MGTDHVFFYGIQGKVPFGIPIRPCGMAEAVKTVPFRRNVPVVEKIIVQKCAADKGGEPDFARPRKKTCMPQRDLYGA